MALAFYDDNYLYDDEFLTYDGVPALSPEELDDLEAALAIWSEEIEAGMTAAELLRVIAAAVAGTSQKAGSTVTFKGVDGATARIVGTFDGDNNRTSAVLDGS